MGSSPDLPGRQLVSTSLRPILTGVVPSSNCRRCFYALLATPANYGIAWLLTQHKTPETLGHKALKSVTIFFGDQTTFKNDADGQMQVRLNQYPTLIWEVVDFSQELATDRLTYEVMWYDFQELENIPYPAIVAGAVA